MTGGTSRYYRVVDVALVSCRRLPEPDPDAEPLARALERAGLDARVLAWDEPLADWASAAVAFIRSSWNYPLRYTEFLRWAEATARVTRLRNPVEIVRWNAHKSYLLDLERRGVAITPTELLRRGEEAELSEVMRRRGWSACVVKPAVSAGSFETMRVERPDSAAGARHLSRLLAERDVLIQEYLPSVEGYGERALVCIDGEVTHAVRKATRFHGQEEAITGPVAISEDEARLARRALEAIGQPVGYGRVDVAPGPRGAPVVMELELIEPSLFFAQSDAALDRYVQMVCREVRAARP